MTTGAQTDTGRLSAIVLAAGAGRRFGGDKLLAPYGEGVLLDGALAAALAAPVSQVIVVTGASAEAVSAAVGEFERAGSGSPPLRLVHAQDHAEGMGASLRAGARAVDPDAAGVFVFLGDMPKIPHAVASDLAVALTGGAPAAAPVYKGRRGHPVLVGAALLPALRETHGDQGLRGVLAGLGERLAEVETDDPGVLFDVDRPEDLDA